MKPVLGCACALFALSILSGGLSAAAPPARVDGGRVAALLRDLDDDDFFVRKKADDALRAMGKSVVPLLKAERARTDSLEVRHRLDRMTESLTADDRIAGWVRLLNHDDPQFREQASQALRHAGAAIVPLLKKELTRAADAQCRARLEKLIDDISR